VFVRDRAAGTTERVSVGAGGIQGNSESEISSISADGQRVVFGSYATDLVPGDTNGYMDVFARDAGPAAAFTPLCFGDGSAAPCPCGNSGAAGHGCENSAGTGGARLSASGVASLSADTVQFTSTGELPSAFSLLLQGDVNLAQVHYGDGLRCVSSVIRRLYGRSASGGVFVAPEGSDPSVSARSAAVGAPISLGATRYYQVYYRDPSASFCPAPLGGTANVSNVIAAAWGS